MKIKELIKVLETADDKNALVSIPAFEKNSRTENIWYNFDDLWNIELYEVSESFLKS